MKFTSRKFLMSLAGMLSGIGTGIAGFVTENETITIIGIICTAISGAIYTICEAMVDIEAVYKDEVVEESEVTEDGDND